MPACPSAGKPFCQLRRLPRDKVATRSLEGWTFLPLAISMSRRSNH